MIVLKYIGKGRFLKNVPARDINEKEASRFEIDKLVESELYERVSSPKKSTSSKPKSSKKDEEKEEVKEEVKESGEENK